MHSRISLDKIEFLKLIIKRHRGIDLSSYKNDFIERRVLARMTMLGINSVDEYIAYVAKHPEEVDKLLDALAINVSEFFRDGADVWNRFAEILRKVCEKHRFVRIWSAGCAHGEEPYTIAILVHETLGPKLSEYNIVVYGTDIDDDALKKAREGMYTYRQVRNVPRSILSKYFIVENGLYRVKEQVKRLVKFMKHDLLNDPPLRFVNIVVCRNVLIYFSREAQQVVLRKFYEALRDDGYLMLGLSEAVFGELEKLFTPIDVLAKIYIKRSNVVG